MAKPQRDGYDAAIEWAAMGSNEPLTAPIIEAEREAA
jgi:hypothetical protein